MQRLMTVFIFIAIFLVIDYYFFQGVLSASRKWPDGVKTAVRMGFWIPTALCVAALFWWAFGDPYKVSANARNFIITGIVATYFSKVFGLIVLFVDDITRLARWAWSFVSPSSKGLPGEAIPRSEFLSKVALATTAVPFTAFVYGIVSGAHDYRIKRITLSLKNLPKAFDGIRIGQLSDIHSGSLWNKVAVQGGVEMLMKEKPEVIFFTGDLVNNESHEIKDFIHVFDKVRAPLGVFSVTGNHDYGDYKKWSSPSAKAENFRDLITAHKELGYDLLMNEHRFIQIGNEKIAVLGNENYGGRNFAKYGKLDQAWKGTEDAPVKLLMSHDPSHWDLEVREKYPDIDAMFAGHTHGFQFGVEVPGFRWSPVQYVYRQWAGLYKENEQYLYVNRGFGYIGYPGRVGIPPELTIFELKAS